MPSSLSLEELYELVPENLRDRMDAVKHAVNNRLACVEMVADMMNSEESLSEEEKKTLEALKFDAIDELADIMKGVLPDPEGNQESDLESDHDEHRESPVFAKGGMIIGGAFIPIFTRFRVAASVAA
jgi:hypothetical protein